MNCPNLGAPLKNLFLIKKFFKKFKEKPPIQTNFPIESAMSSFNPFSLINSSLTSAQAILSSLSIEEETVLNKFEGIELASNIASNKSLWFI